jgi:N4-gp56 family major capsid protein
MLTQVGVNSPQAVKRWGIALATDTEKQMYFSRFIGSNENSIIQRKTELEDDAGDEVSFDLNMRLRGGMTYGDSVVEGSEEALTFYQDKVRIDQARKGASAGGKMSRKRTLHNLRQLAKDRSAEYIAEWMDEGLFVYLSGDAGFSAINQDSKFPAAFAGNAVEAPDADHILFGGAATSKATIAAADKMSFALLERVAVKPRMMNAVNPDVVKMSPVTVEGEKRYVVLMSPFQAHSLRTETGDLSWTKVQQALATSEGRKSPITKGGLGLVNGLILHEHENVRRFSDYGAGSNVQAARALLLGRQAGVVAYGQGGNKGSRYSWVEKMFDADNQVAVYCGTICGMKKVRYNGKDFGVTAIDTASTDPNAA